MSNVKIHKFIECAVPIKACNLRCSYCYVTQNKWWSSDRPDFTYCKDKIKKAFSVERLGGTCMFNLCATGETLIEEDVIFIIKQLLEIGHYVMVVTNGTLTKRIEECCNFSSDLKSRLFFKMSFHYLELKRIGMLDTFFSNARKAKDSGISITVEITPDDCYIPYIEEIMNVCNKELGTLCHVTVPRDECKKGYPLMTSLPREEFVNKWKCFDSELFNFKESIFEIKRKEFCYAGKWSFVVNLVTGDYSQCYAGKKLGNIYTNLNAPIKEEPVGCNCCQGHCFNGHAFLGFGLIPELATSDYADMRNRVLKDGSQWLSKPMEEAMRFKLKMDNTECGNLEKIYYNIKSYNYKWKIREFLKRIHERK